MKLYLEKRNPWAELDRIGRQWYEASRSTGFIPTANVWGNENEVHVDVDVPGVDPKSLKIQVQKDILSLQGERKAREIAKEDAQYLCEQSAGAFERAIRLPFEIESGKVQAHCENGVLNITLPRREESKPKTIDIEIK